MAPLPAPIRAGLGLLATALDTVQELVEHAPEIPMEAVGNSMQLSLRLQQHYAALLTRGDEFLAGLRGAPDEPPSWATFDDLPPTASDDGDEAGTGSRSGLDEELPDVPAAELQDEPRQAGQGDPLLDAALSAQLATAAAGSAGTQPTADEASADTVGQKVGARKVAAKKVPAKKVPATKAAAKKASSTKIAAVAPAKVPAKKAPAKRTPAKKAAAEKAAAARSTGRTRAGGSAAHDPDAEQTAGAGSVTAPPRLDAALTNGQASARARSAFDLAESGDSASTEDATPNDSLLVDVPVLDDPIVDALVDGEPAAREAPGSVPGA